jgi:hypothetical protein
MNLVLLTFHPNQANPARASGKGVWRVRGFSAGGGLPNTPRVQVVYGCLILVTARHYQIGSRVDPRNALFGKPKREALPLAA